MNSIFVFEDKGMKKKIAVFFTVGFMILAMLGGCLPPKQVISGYDEPGHKDSNRGGPESG